CRLMREKLELPADKWSPDLDNTLKEPRATVLIPGSRVRYLAEIAEQGRGINRQIETQAETADRAQSYWQSLHDLEDPKLPKQLDLYQAEDLQNPSTNARSVVGATSVANATDSGTPEEIATHVAPTTEERRTPETEGSRTPE